MTCELAFGLVGRTRSGTSARTSATARRRRWRSSAAARQKPASARRSNGRRATLMVEIAVPEFVEAARGLLPTHRFEQLSELDWLLTTSRDLGPGDP